MTSDRLGPHSATLLALALFVYFLLYPHTAFLGMVADNISQTAYWYLLGQPHLVGSIGSSAPKAGLILLLGSSHFASYHLLDSPWLLKAVLSLFAAGTVLITGRIATDVGGRGAGALAMVVIAGSSYLNAIFFRSSSELFFIPVALFGLWLLTRSRDRAGILVLCLGLTLRLEGGAVAGLAGLWVGWRRRAWRPALESLAYVAVTTLLVLLMAYWVQGSWSRFSAGPSTGYLPHFALKSLAHLTATVAQFFSELTIRLLLVPAIYTLVRLPKSRLYLLFLSISAVTGLLFALDIVGAAYRYIASVQVVIVALGCGGLFLLTEDLLAWKGPDPTRAVVSLWAALSLGIFGIACWATGAPLLQLFLFALPAVLGLAAWTDARLGGEGRRILTTARVVVIVAVAGVFCLSGLANRESYRGMAQKGPLEHGVKDGIEFLRRPIVPSGESVLTEDELLNYVIATAPDYLGQAQSIQAFNVSAEPLRRRILARTHYLYISKRSTPNSNWHYLFYLPRDAWKGDAFRKVVLEMIRTNRPRTIYGVKLTPVENSKTRFVARVQSLPDRAARRIQKPRGPEAPPIEPPKHDR